MFIFLKSLGDKTDRYVYSSLGFPFSHNPWFLVPEGLRRPPGISFLFILLFTKNLQDKSESGSVGYSHSSCSFHYVFVDSTLVLCGRPVRAAIHLLVS